MENFGRYVAIASVIALLFLIPIANNKEKIQRIRELHIENLRMRYIEHVMKYRVISLAEWEDFCTQVNRYGGGYDIELSVGVLKHIPTEDSLLNGSMYDMHYEKEIEEVLYQTGNYVLEHGAQVMIKLDETEAGAGISWMREEEL